MHSPCTRPFRTGLGALVLWLAASTAAGAIDKTWTGNSSTTWSTAGNWTPSGAPGTGDRAIIPTAPGGGVFPIVVSSTTINQLQVQAGAQVTINSGVDLDVDGGVSPFIDGTGTVVTLGTGRIEITGGSSGSTLINASMTLGNLALNASSGNSYRVTTGQTVVFNGNLTIQSGEFRLGTGGSGAVTLDVNGTLLIADNGTLNVSVVNSVIRLAGNWTQTGAWLSGNNSTVVFDGTAAQLIDIDRRRVQQFDFEHLRVSNTSGTVTYVDNNLASNPNGFNVVDNLTVDAGATLIVQDFARVGNSAGDVFGIGSGATVIFERTFDPDCAISFDIDAGADNGTLILRGPTFPPGDTADFGYSLAPGNGTVRIETTSSGTLNLTDGGPYTFWDLVIDTNTGGGQAGGDVLTPSSGFTVLNDLILVEGELAVPAITITVGRNLDSSAAPTNTQLDFTGAGTVRVGGNVDLDSISQGVTSFGTLHMNGTAPQTLTIRASAASSFHDLDNFRVSNPAGVTVLDNPAADFIVNGTLTLDTGGLLIVQDAFDPEGPVVFSGAAAGTLRLEGAIIDDASELGTSFTAGTGTVVYAQTSASTVFTRINGGTAISYFNLTIDTAGAVATQQAGGLLDVNGTFAVDAGGVFTAGSSNMTAGGSFVADGTFNAGTFIVTMDGTGTLSGTAPALAFHQFLVNGATTSVVTAARGFSVANTFQVIQGRLTSSGLAAPITIAALSGVTAGNGSGGSGTAVLELVGPATLAVAAGQSFTVGGTDGRFVANSNGSGTPTLTRSGVAGTFNAVVNGQIDVRRLNFSFGDAEGLDVAAGATIQRLSGITFTNVNAAAGSRFLSIASAGLDLDCPGIVFGALTAGTNNVRLLDTAAGGTPVRVRFELRDATMSPPGGGGGGPGAGEAFDADADTNENGLIDAGETSLGGAIAYWVYTANVDLSGAVQGFPMPAFDWNTFAYYSTYVLMRDASGTTDTLFVLDAFGDLKGYSFPVPADQVIGPIFWDTEGAGTHVVYFGTSTGRVYKLIDTGAALVTAPAPWNTPYFSSAVLDEVTSPLISDQTNLYFGGQNDGNNGIYRLQISTKTVPSPGPISTASRAVLTAPAWAEAATGRSLYFATTANNAGTPGSRIYRVNTATWTIDATYTSASAIPPAPDAAPLNQDCRADIEAIINVPTSVLYVGETNGYLHALPALGTPAQFVVPLAGFPFRDSTSAIRGGAIQDPLSGRLFYGNDAGSIYTLMLLGTPWSLDSNYFRFASGSGAVQRMPLFLGGVLYVPHATGNFTVLDANNGAALAPKQTRLYTYTLSNVALSDVARDFNTGRVYVASAGGRLHSIAETADPTPAAP